MKGACYCELAIMKDNRTGGRRVVNGAQNGNINNTEGAADDVAMRPVTMRDNMRLIAGFTVMVMGAFLFFSILSFFFYWKEDMSALAQIGVPMADPQFSNICGKGGARVASAIVGEGFGLFSIVIPIALLIWGWRVFRYKPLRLLRSVPICGLVLILGSLTLGFIFGTSWDIFGSGLGGSYGIAMKMSLKYSTGTIGTLLIILAGWILTGLLIDRNFLRTVDNKGAKVAGEVTDATKRLWGYVHHAKSAKGDLEHDEELLYEDEPSDDDSTVESVEEESVAADGEMEVATEEIPAEEHAVAETTESAANEDEEEYEMTTEPIDVERVVAEQPVTAEQAEELLGVDDEQEAIDGEDDELIITVEQRKVEQVDEEDIENDLYDPMRDLHSYEPPMPSLLIDHKSKAVVDDEEIFQNKERIRETLLNFGIPIRSMHATVGPTVTLYEIVQEQGVKISKIQGLESDIAQNLKALGIRIIAPIPGKGTVGIEVPNLTKQTVSMRSAICSPEFQESKAELPVVIGRTIQNENYTFDLAKMPHLLVAGATGQGKSVGLNAIITSLLYRKHPAELKFVLIDPKMVEFSLYNKLEKHFLAKMESEDESIVTDPKKAVYTLNALCTEMANRLELCKMAHAKNIVEYNDKFLHRQLNPENGHRFLPYIVVVIDEFADLIMTAKEVEAPVMRLAQKARAIGIHLIVATQRPDVKVITGGIKANFPARIAFRVMQMTDSRTIIDQPGANQLIGRGDMLLSNGGELTRIQCAFVDTPEVERIVDHIYAQQGYPSAYNLPDYTPEAGGGEAMTTYGSEESSAPQKYDPKFGDIAREAVANGIISTSMIQRNFEVGFNRAGRIMLQLERAGIVGPQIGSKPREIKFYDLPSLEAKLQDLGIF